MLNQGKKMLNQPTQKKKKSKEKGLNDKPWNNW
jgi:hypothetical protein